MNKKRRQRIVRQLFKEQKGLCFYCSTKMKLPTSRMVFSNMATLEHLVPQSIVKEKFTNLLEKDVDLHAVCCHDCNTGRGNKSVRLFLREIGMEIH